MIEETHESHEMDLKGKVTDLTRDLEQTQSEVSWWKDRCHALEQQLSQERAAKEDLPRQLGTTVNTAPHAPKVPDTVPIRLRRSIDNRRSREHRVSNSEIIHQSTESQGEPVPSGCGSCSTTHCQCIEDAFQISSLTESPDTSAAPKRPHSRTSHDNSKRPRPESQVKTEPEQLEIDFTARFTGSRPQAPVEMRAASTAHVDRCGFCDDGTACICAEIAEHVPHQEIFENNRLAPIQHLSQFTPPPSDGDVREVTLPSISQATNPCINGPGTCAQCLADPRSTLFCKTLAASRAANGSSGGCCGGNGPDGGCCQSQNLPRNAAAKDSTSLTLTCADAFTTLSRHPNFSQASDELSSWLPKLHTSSHPQGVSGQDSLEPSLSNRPAMEVEAASVMGVLRYFDRRFASR